ncbi:MAG TPA: hypothetical protein VKM93_03205 [Terriglobia bacterium]|nr:hypothetical protein [Terriglobia bacterium]
MATAAATGNGPLEFTDANGNQVSIPLSALQFVNGSLGVNSSIWTPFTGYAADEKAVINDLLAYASGQGLITPAVVPAPKPALTVKAVSPGSMGNNIQVTVAVSPAASGDPTQATFSITVTETDTWTGLTSGTIESVLGSDKSTGSTPGLVHVVDGSVTKTPTDLPAPLASTPLVAAASPTTSATLAVMDATANPVFTLEAKGVGSDGNTTSVAISVDTTTKTFTLAATWTKPALTGLTIADVAAQVKSNLNYEIAVSAPASGLISVPAATGSSVIQLSGGSDGTSPTAASATVFASQ